MMSLKQAARAFDDQIFSDVHGNSADFSGKLLPFNDSTRSGPATQRRILDTSNESAIPVEREIVSGGVVYIVAHKNVDFFKGEIIRVKYPVLPAAGVFFIRNISQVLDDFGGVAGAYLMPMYIRRAIFEDQANYSGGYIIYGSSYYSIRAGEIVGDGTKYFVAREDSRVDEAGFGAVEVTDLSDPIQYMDVALNNNSYDAVSDSYTPVTLSGVKVFIEHYSLDFENTSLGFVDIQPGDKAISVLKSAVSSIHPGDRIGAYRVVAVKDRGGFWTAHGRKQ